MYYLPSKQTLGGGNFKNKNIKWKSKSSQFKSWCQGKTGIPIVDAGMRQLNETGWMHNRLRLIVSNFLSLVLGIDWRKGEKYFAQKLIDYDPSSNNGNWQFSAQVGIDRVPYLRIYNPFTQAKEVDGNCVYIKKWVKELKDVDCYDILRWDKVCKEYKGMYRYPIVDIQEGMRDAKKRYKRSRR
jgi:deoxyribodipyrimidine photo-lyase